jgi:hypothetical protein
MRRAVAVRNPASSERLTVSRKAPHGTGVESNSLSRSQNDGEILARWLRPERSQAQALSSACCSRAAWGCTEIDRRAACEPDAGTVAQNGIAAGSARPRA